MRTVEYDLNGNVIPLSGSPIQTNGIEARWLLSKAMSVTGDIVELGTYLGETARELALCFPNRRIYAVDLPANTSNYPSIVHGMSAGEFAKELPNVSVELVGDAFRIPEGVGFIYIDGDHSRRGIMNDTVKAAEYFLGGPDGTVVWHDVEHEAQDRAHAYFPHILDYLLGCGLDVCCVAGTRLAYCDFHH